MRSPPPFSFVCALFAIYNLFTKNIFQQKVKYDSINIHRGICEYNSKGIPIMHKKVQSSMRRLLSFFMVWTFLVSAFPFTNYAVEGKSEEPASSVSSVAASQKAVLLGVDSAGHDHVSLYSTVSNSLISCGFSSTSTQRGSFTGTDIRNYFKDQSTSLFVSRSHGSRMLSSNGTVSETSILLSDSGASLSSTGVSGWSTDDFSHLKLVLYVACYTGSGGSSANNLTKVTVDKGAETSIGFQHSVNCGMSNTWTIAFFSHLSRGKTVSKACSLLAADAGFIETGLASYTVCGNRSLTLT